MIVIYGRTQCEFCKQARDVCTKWKLEYEYKNIEYNSYLTELFENHGQEIGVPHIGGLVDCPYIVWHGKYIGHLNELLRAIEETIGGYGEGAF